MQKNKSKRTAAGNLFAIIGTIVILIPILTALTLLMPRLIGYSEYSIVSGSMEPDYPVGSLVFVKETSPESIKRGDVITYEKADTAVTHRVVANNSSKRQLITKGDANKINDPYPISYEQIKGIVIECIPKAGAYIEYAKSTKGMVMLIILVAAGFGMIIASTYMKKQ